ncbi:MAG: thioredoxin domain-containing protein [Pseudomonadota bacterium]|nr:thioredoxin domain-containing protein [Pseudomonadota bacterium]
MATLINKDKIKKHALYLLLPLVGLIFSSYTISHHYSTKMQSGETYRCNINATFNCDAVANSPYSELFNVPLGIYGAAYFLLLLVLLGIGLSNTKSAHEHALAYTYANITGTGVSLLLGVISHLNIKAYCITCIGVYCVCFLQTLLLIVQRRQFVFKGSIKDLIQGVSTAALVVAAVIAIHSFTKPVMPVQQQTQATTEQTLKTVQLPINKSRYVGNGEDYRFGSDTAKVKVVEFVDFQCPSCKRLDQNLSELKKQFGERVLFVFKNFPLDKKCNKTMKHAGHPLACEIATLARCAGEAGKFWPYHDLAFAEQEQAKTASPVSWAKQIGLSDQQIETCKSSAWIIEKIKEDVELGIDVGVQGTPALFINGRLFANAHNLAALRTEIERLLADAQD